MKNAKQMIQHRWRLILGLTIAFIIALIGQDIVREVIIFRKEIEILETEFLRDIQDDVYDLVADVESDFSNIIDDIYVLSEAHGQEHLSPLAIAADAIVDLHASKPLVEVQSDIISLTQTYGIDDQNHHYYVYTTDGILRYNGETDTIVSENQWLAEDSLGRLYIQELITEIDTSIDKTARVIYYIDNGTSIEPIALCATEIEGSNLIIANIIPINTYNQVLKNESIEQLNERYHDADNSVYILSSTGEILFHQNEDAVGINLDSSNYPVWTETLQIIVDFHNKEGEGFLEYEFYSNYQNGVIEHKIAYIKYLEEWDIIIGASSSSDVYNDIFLDYITGNYQTVLLVKIPAYIIIVIIAILIFVYVRRNINMSTSILKEEEHLYRIFADMTSDIIMITDTQGKIIFTNKQGKDIIYGDRMYQDDVFFDQILVEEDGYYILYGVKQDLFVKFITEEIIFNSEKADLFIIVNVTDKIQTERKLEALSMKDELTSLGNRRMMVHDYNNTILPFAREGGISHLVMLDLDDFKPANDLYGHSFGDVVLQNIAGIFRDKMTDTIKFYRIGGDEFAILFMDYSQQQVVQFLKELQEEVRLYPYEKDVEVGFSAGVVQIQVTDSKRRFSDFYDKADKLMYQSKAAGKNSIHT